MGSTAIFVPLCASFPSAVTGGLLPHASLPPILRAPRHLRSGLPSMALARAAMLSGVRKAQQGWSLTKRHGTRSDTHSPDEKSGPGSAAVTGRDVAADVDASFGRGVRGPLLVGLFILGHESHITLTLLLTAAPGLPGSEGKLGWPSHCLDRG